MLTGERRATTPDDRRTGPGRAIAERFRVEMAMERIVDNALTDLLTYGHEMALTSFRASSTLTAAAPPPAVTDAFDPGQMAKVWNESMAVAVAGGFPHLLAVLPEDLAALMSDLYGAGRLLEMLQDQTLTEALYFQTLNLFSTAHESGMHVRDVERALDFVFSRVLEDGSPSGIQTRAQRMARSAATRTYNHSMLQQIMADGFTLKLWVSHHDERTRDTHMHTDGVAIPLDDAFRVGGGFLLYPGDPYGPIGETINCRCVLVGETGQPSYGIDWDQPVLSLSERIESQLEVSNPSSPYPLGPSLDPRAVTLLSSAYWTLAFNPAQARAPKGTPLGGRWIDTPSGLLDRLKSMGVEKNIGQDVNQLPVPQGTKESMAPLMGVLTNDVNTRGQRFTETIARAMSAYQNDTVHYYLSTYLRGGQTPPPADPSWPSLIDPTQDPSNNPYGPGAHLTPLMQFGSTDWSKDTFMVEGTVRSLDYAMAHMRTSTVSRVYKGISSTIPSEEYTPGMTWYEDSFSSTTQREDWADNFARMRTGEYTSLSDSVSRLREQNGNPVVLTLVVDEGVGFIPGAGSVNEIILDRGLRFEVLSNDGKGQVVVGVSKTQFTQGPTDG